MLKSKKLFVSVLVVLALFTMSANATVSRLEGLGGSGDSFWWGLPGNIFVMHDAATPGIWPQLIQQYPNLAGGEFNYDPTSESGGWDLQKVYVDYAFAKDHKSVLQFSLDRLYSTRFFNTAFATNPGVPSRLNLIYGRKVSDNLLFGGALSYEGQSAETKDDADTTNGNQSSKFGASVIGLKVGLSGVGDTEWDAVLGVELPSFTNEAANTTLAKNDGSMGFHFAGRYWWHYGDKTALIPTLRYSSIKDASTYDGTPTPSASVTTTQLGIGAGHNWWPVENTLVLFDFGILLQKEKGEFANNPGNANYDETTNVLPYWRLGFETTVFSWLDGRLGAERGWVSSKAEGAAYPTAPKASTSETNTFLGATAHWNRMIFDLVVHPDFIMNGPYFISGSSSSMFTRVSLKYDFNQ